MSVTSPVRSLGRAAFVWWPWLVPLWIVAFIFVTRGVFLDLGVSALLALVAVLLAARRPDRSLLILIGVLPFQTLVLAQLYAWGVPAGIVRPLAGWKEVLALGVIVAGVQGFRARQKRLDRLDVLGLVYVGVVAAYALLPQLFSPGAPSEANVRSLAFRASAGFVLLLLGARHAPLPEGFASRAAQFAMIVGAIVSAIAVYEYFFSDSWNTFIVDRVQYIRYQFEILDVSPFNFVDIRRYGHIGGQKFLRVGSVLLDPLTLGFFLLVPFAVAIERTLRVGLRSSSGAVFGLIGAALLFTQTRAALLGALVIAFIAVRPAIGRPANRRAQFTLLFAAAMLIALPAATATGLSERATTTASGEEQSAVDHVKSFWTSTSVISKNPLGQGLGTSAGTGQRFQVGNTTISENNYLQVGIETGVIAMAVFVALTVALIRRLNRAARSVDDLGTAAIRSAGIGLAIGAFFLHTWNDFAVAWTFWGLAGAALGIAEIAPRPHAPEAAGEGSALSASVPARADS